MLIELLIFVKPSVCITCLKMIQSKMYCAEQIVIPAKFPNILKTYAKGNKCGSHHAILTWKHSYSRNKNSTL